MKIIIVDDEKMAANALADKLKEYDETELVGVAYNGMDGLKLLEEKQPDLMFLDVELPDISGIEFLERIDGMTDGRCRVVMYTAHGRYMLPAFRNKAFDFLLKPIEDNELRMILRRACIDRRPTCSTANRTLPTTTTETTPLKLSTTTEYLSATTENILSTPMPWTSVLSTFATLVYSPTTMS